MQEERYLQAKDCLRLLKLGEQDRTDSPTDLRRNQLCQHLDLGLLASRTVR